MADLDTYGDETRNYEERDYGSHSRNRSRSPDGDHSRQRDEPPSHRDDRGPPERPRESEDALNTGSNLFVTGIHPRLGEAEITRLFEKYGAVEKCNIMRDPHTRDSRGFGFVKMETAQEADAAKDALQGQVYEGRTLSIEKARRSRPRTPTPGKYYGPPKRDDPPRRGYRGGDRYQDDRGYGRRDDSRRGGGYRDRYDDRGSYGRRDDYQPRDRYRDDRYGSDRDRGYGNGGYDRSRGPSDSGGYGRDAPADIAPSRGYDERRRYE